MIRLVRRDRMFLGQIMMMKIKFKFSIIEIDRLPRIIKHENVFLVEFKENLLKLTKI